MNWGQGRPPGAKNKGAAWRRLARIEKAAILTSRGIFSNEQVAAFIGIHPQTLIYLKQTPEFKARMISLQTGIIEQHSEAVRLDEEFQSQQLREMVPIGIQKLKELMLHGNPNVALKATQDLLDREGTHAKISRTAIDVKEQVNLNILDAVAQSIQNVLATAPKLPEDRTQDEVTSEFTKGATDSTSQIYMMEEQIGKETLENLDPKKLKIN
jgi:hypothetical protein